MTRYRPIDVDVGDRTFRIMKGRPGRPAVYEVHGKKRVSLTRVDEDDPIIPHVARALQQSVARSKQAEEANKDRAQD